MTKTVPWGQYSGIVKVIPPEGWTRTVPPITKRSLAGIRIKKPIQQNMLGGAGQFRQTNVEKLKSKPLTLRQWFEKSQHRNFAGPGPKDLDRTLDRDSEQARAQRAAEEQARMDMRLAKKAKKAKRDESERMRVEKLEAHVGKWDKGSEVPLLKEEGEEQSTFKSSQMVASDEAQPEISQPLPDESGNLQDNQDGDVEIEDPLTTLPALDPSSATSPVSSSDPQVCTPQPEPIPQWYETFDPMKSWLPKETTLDDYTPEACATLDRKFWKNMGLGEPAWYGADLQGKLFTQEMSSLLKHPKGHCSKTRRRHGTLRTCPTSLIACIALCRESMSHIYTSASGGRLLLGTSKM